MDYSKELSIGIIMFPGSNCAEDMKRYFPNSFYIWHLEETWKHMDLLIIPGGFAFGDRDYECATGKYFINCVITFRPANSDNCYFFTDVTTDNSSYTYRSVAQTSGADSDATAKQGTSTLFLDVTNTSNV